MRLLFSLSITLLPTVASFSAPPQYHHRTVSHHRHAATLNPGDNVMLIGPGFLQLVLAKTCKAAGLTPIIVGPQSKLESFQSLVKDDSIMMTIGMPEVGEPTFGTLAAVVFCAEDDSVLPAAIIDRVLNYKDQNQLPWVEGGLKKVVCCAPISNKIVKEKSMGWIPIFNNDNTNDKLWNEFLAAYSGHPLSKAEQGTLVRYGSLLGGSVDGPECLREMGIDEKMYKMTLEQYRDLKERGFDRFKLGAQILSGDTNNPKPPNQDKLENQALKKDEYKEAFRVTSGYPEQDRANRHTVAQAIVQSLLLENVPKEFTVLSKGSSFFPSDKEWNDMFANPGPAQWPDPFAWDPVKNGGFQEK